LGVEKLKKSAKAATRSGANLFENIEPSLVPVRFDWGNSLTRNGMSQIMQHDHCPCHMHLQNLFACAFLYVIPPQEDVFHPKCGRLQAASSRAGSCVGGQFAVVAASLPRQVAA
jgi:hypothetical protein